MKRTTTINHAFASALAPADPFDEARVLAAMELLGQTDRDNLTCTYCDDPAETWDHLRGLVVKSQFSGFGHVLGNLVPCCKPCNSKKGNAPWEEFLTASAGASSAVRRRRIEAYVSTFAP